MAALAVGLTCCPPAGAIVGGGLVPIERASRTRSRSSTPVTPPTAPDGQYCGGSVRDPTHIVTAAHCVFDTSSSSQRPADDRRRGRRSSLGARTSASSSAQQRDRRPCLLRPGLRLEEPAARRGAADALTAPASTSGVPIQPLDLISDADWAALSAPAPLFVTGWGVSDTNGNQAATNLRGAEVNLVGDQPCGDSYESDIPPLPYDGSIRGVRRRRSRATGAAGFLLGRQRRTSRAAGRDDERRSPRRHRLVGQGVW